MIEVLGRMAPRCGKLLLLFVIVVSLIGSVHMFTCHRPLKATGRKLENIGLRSNLLMSTQNDVAWQLPRVSILTEITDEPGALYDILRYFWKYEINLTHIESRPSPKNTDGFHVYIDFQGFPGEERTDKLMKELSQRCRNTLVLDERKVPWFPRHISELDRIAPRTLDANSELVADHPGFHDKVYRERRAELAQIALDYRYNHDIPYIPYTQSEIDTWGVVYNKLQQLHKQHACQEYLDIMPMMEKHCGYSPNNIPQARDISKFLEARTGFRIRPVAGLLSSRDFLNGLAFRTFFSTQYIRHASMPLYTPEPDICHELIGYATFVFINTFIVFILLRLHVGTRLCLPTRISLISRKKLA